MGCAHTYLQPLCRKKYVTNYKIIAMLHKYTWFCFFFGATASSFTRFVDHTQWLNTVGRTPLDEGSARRRDLYLTTHTPLTTDNIHAPDRIRTHNLSRRAAVDLRLRPRGHWDRLSTHVGIPNTWNGTPWMKDTQAHNKEQCNITCP